MTMNEDPRLFGGKELPVVGAKVTAITLDSDIVILLGMNREHEFRIANEVIMRRGASQPSLVVQFDPYNQKRAIRQNLTELSEIIDQIVLHARPYLDGTLEVELESDLRLRVLPLARYEAWTYTFGNYILACPPGGFS